MAADIQTSRAALERGTCRFAPSRPSRMLLRRGAAPSAALGRCPATSRSPRARPASPRPRRRPLVRERRLPRRARSRSSLSRSASRDDTRRTTTNDVRFRPRGTRCQGVSVSPAASSRSWCAKASRTRFRAQRPRWGHARCRPRRGLGTRARAQFVLPSDRRPRRTRAAQSARAQTMPSSAGPVRHGHPAPYAALEEVTGVAGGAVRRAVLVGKAAFVENGGGNDVRVGGHASGGRGDGPERRGRPRGADEAWRAAAPRKASSTGAACSPRRKPSPVTSFFVAALPAFALGTAGGVHRARRVPEDADGGRVARDRRGGEEKFLWRPFAAATADDVPTFSNEAAPRRRSREGEAAETAKPRV